MDAKKRSLSVCLAVYNEEKVLAECLESVKSIADELIIVDGHSSDASVKIARSFGARVISVENLPNFHINKQKALEACRGDWILQLDADEIVTKELAEQIRLVVEGRPLPLVQPKKQRLFSLHQKNIELRDGKIHSNAGEIMAYFMPRKNYFLGKYLLHGGAYPDGEIRLVKRGHARFPAKSVHEQIEIQGRVAWLSADLIHLGDPNFERYLQRANRYTSVTADELQKKQTPFTLGFFIQYVFIKPFTIWFLLFFRHKGFLDGFPGFVFALFSGLHYTMAYIKYRERSHV